MAFHEVLFPTNVSIQSSAGPSFRTDIISLDSGHDQAVSRWSRPRRKYDVSYGIKSIQMLATVQQFMIARRGSANGFRLRDWLDFSTNPADPRGAYHWSDQLLAAGDGVTTEFQLARRYVSGGFIQLREIFKPIEGEIAVGIDDAEHAGGWWADHTTGRLHLPEPLAEGSNLFWGGHYDTPVRFDGELDELVAATLIDFDQGSMNIPLIEVLGDSLTLEDYWYGGGWTHNMSADIYPSPLVGRALLIEPKIEGLSVYMPHEESLKTGGPYFYILNNGDHPVTIRDRAENDLATLLVGSMAKMILFASGWEADIEGALV